MLFFHICLACRLWRNSLLNLLQNSLVICFTCCHLPFEYASSQLNSPDGDMTTIVLIVRWLLGESDTSFFESLMVSTVSGLELMISSTSEGFNIQGVTVGLQQSFQNSSCRSNLAFPDSSHMRSTRWVVVPQNPICSIFL